MICVDVLLPVPLGKHYDVDKEAGDAWGVAMKLFEAVDDNGDGELSWAELHEYLTGPQVRVTTSDDDALPATVRRLASSRLPVRFVFFIFSPRVTVSLDFKKTYSTQVLEKKHSIKI